MLLLYDARDLLKFYIAELNVNMIEVREGKYIIGKHAALQLLQLTDNLHKIQRGYQTIRRGLPWRQKNTLFENTKTVVDECSRLGRKAFSESIQYIF